MPAQDGKLTEAEKAKIIAWLNEKGRTHNCPFCSQNNWSLGEHLLSGSLFYGGTLMLGGSAYPQFFLVCTNCAYTKQYMAVPVLGTVALEVPQPEATKKEARGSSGGG